MGGGDESRWRIGGVKLTGRRRLSGLLPALVDK